MNRTDRLMAMLLELQARGEVRAADLAEHFEVSVRTVYRDMEALAEGGVPLVATPGKGYRLLEGYFLPPLSFTGAEAGLLMLGGEFVRDRVDPELRGAAATALAKLASVLSDAQRAQVDRWRAEVRFPTAARSDDGRLGPLRAAIQERRVVRLLYHTYRRPAAEPREVEPLSLIYLRERWHLAAYCRTRQAPRLFSLQRIDRLDVLDERFEPDPRHVVPPVADGPRAEAPEARVRFDPAVERWVRERQPFTLLREEVDARGPVFVYALRHEGELARWLLGWGDAVEVLAPPALRARLAHEARAVWRRHAARPEGALGRRAGEFEAAAGATDRPLSGALAHAGSGV